MRSNGLVKGAVVMGYLAKGAEVVRAGASPRQHNVTLWVIATGFLFFSLLDGWPCNEAPGCRALVLVAISYIVKRDMGIKKSPPLSHIPYNQNQIR